MYEALMDTVEKFSNHIGYDCETGVEDHNGGYLAQLRGGFELSLRGVVFKYRSGSGKK